MIEKNRNILSDAINKMPVRKPKASGWGAVSGGLDQTDAGGGISNSASILPRHKAPADAWSKIAAALPSTPLINTFPGKLIIGMLIVGGIAIAYILLPDSEDNIKSIQKEESMPATVDNTPASSPIKESEDQISLVPNPKEKSQAIPSPTKPVETEMISQSSPPKVTSPAVTFVNVLPDPIAETEELRVLTPIKITYLENGRWENRIAEIERIAPSNSVDVEYAKNMTKAEFKAGVFYAFKRYQKIEEEGMDIPQNQSSVGLELTYKKDKWFFKTGLAYVAWEEKGDYIYDYDQNQLVYQYNYVDSTFINPTSGGVTYYTTETFVYDSVAGQQQDQASYNYKMLQVPLLVGYRLFEHKNFNIGILGGVGFDIRLSGKQFVPVFNLDGSTVTEVNSSLKYRTTNNWRLMGGIELGYVFARKWELYTEPTFQYYMKPLYSPENTKGIGLFNIKAGIRYIF